MTATTDILGRDEIVRLVDRFYEKVRDDETLGFIFDKVAQVDWPMHLPMMYDFWQTVLFRDGDCDGDGRTNFQEFQAGTNPAKAARAIMPSRPGGPGCDGAARRRRGPR